MESEDFIIEDGVLTFYKGARSNVIIPFGVTCIGKGAFLSCDTLISVCIPDGVLRIEDEAFRNCENLRTVVMPDSLTTIGNQVFYLCNTLRSIVIPVGVTSIGIQVFAFCEKLESLEVSKANKVFSSRNNCILRMDGNDVVLLAGCKTSVIPLGVTRIWNNAFRGCSDLTSVVIPDTVKSIEYCAFMGCVGLTSVVIPDGVTSIEYNAFYGCTALRSVVIPDSVTEIDKSAFWFCQSLRSLTLGKGATQIYANQFAFCKGLESIEVCENNKRYYSKNNCVIDRKTKTLVIGCKTSVIPDNVMTIGEGAFWGRSDITSMVFGSNVSAIEKYAFKECEGLTSIRIENPNLTIREAAFDECNALHYVDFPEGFNYVVLSKINYFLGFYKFGDCFERDEQFVNWLLSGAPDKAPIDKMAEYYRQNSYDVLSKIARGDLLEAFNVLIGVAYLPVIDIDSLDDMIALTSSTELRAAIMDYKNQKYTQKELDMNQEIQFDKALGCKDYSLADLKRLFILHEEESGYVLDEFRDNKKDVFIPAQIDGKPIVAVNNFAFYKCKLNSVTIGDNVTIIGIKAFGNCESLTSVIIGNNVKYIGENTFAECNSLASIVIDNNVERIGAYAFSCCEKLMKVTIGADVTYIGEMAFGDCENLRDIYYEGTVKEFNAIDKGEDWCGNIQTVIIHCKDGDFDRA